MKRKLIEVEKLKAWMDENQEMLVLDVMNPEYFTEKHIKGAQNAPVYEMGFPTYLEKMDINKSTPVVVYGGDEKSLAIQDASSKLIKLGFQDVYEFPGGLSKWEQAGYEVEKGQSVIIPSQPDGKYNIDVENSLVGWSGRNVKYAHRGSINVKAGNIDFKVGKLMGGEFVLDMTTIKDLDLVDDMWRGILESHLKSSDFFDVENFPEASFVIQKATLLDDALIGAPNYKLSGLLNIKDVSGVIEFSAMIVPIEDGSVNGQAHFDFDRTLWNVRYGSEKFFEKLGMHLVNDLVSLELFLVAKK